MVVAVFRPYLFNGKRRKQGLSVNVGPFKVGGLLLPNHFCLLWTIGNKHYGQAVRRVWVRKHIAKVVCPTCGTKTWRMFNVDGSRFLCQNCAGLRKGYDAHHRNGAYRQPRTAAAWVRWYVRRAGKALKGGKSGETQACPTGGCPGGAPGGR